MSQFADFIKAGQFLPSAAPAFVYRGAGSLDRSKTFTLEVGFPVADDTKPVGDFKIGKLESLKCATTIYMGPSREIGRAYERIYAQIFAQGLVPSDVRRERYLYYDGDSSKNNIVLIEIALKD
jgi:effector-binding domain-containing protein